MARFFHVFFSILTFLLCLQIPEAGAADFDVELDTKPEKIKPTDVLNSMIQAAPSPGGPDWLKRTTIQLLFGEDYKPSYMLETVQPIYRFTPGKDNIFTQINAHQKGGEQTYNIGLGYRNIIASTVIIGVNAFYDYTTYYDHQRAGAGLEALGVDYEARINTYFRVTAPKEVRTNITERVMTGFDSEVGGNILPFRFLDDLRLYAGYQYFNGEYGDDKKYYTARMAYPVTDFFELEAKMYKEENKDEKFFIQLTGGLDMPLRRGGRAIEREARLKRKLLQPVEREHDLVIEQKSSSSGTFTVKVKRGS